MTQKLVKYKVRVWRKNTYKLMQVYFSNTLRNCFGLISKRVQQGYECDMKISNVTELTQRVATMNKCDDGRIHDVG